MTQTQTLGQFLLEQLDLDEIDTSRSTPAQRLADIEAKRRIIARLTQSYDTFYPIGADIFRLLGLQYADQPGYQSQWRL